MSVKNEIWKPIQGFENKYMVSSLGRIKNINTLKILKNKINKYGYSTTVLFKNQKRYYFQTHRLVALHFIELDGIRNQVNHKDGNKLNNNIENLEWVTGSENQIHSYKNGLQKKKFGGENQSAVAIYQMDKHGLILKKWNSIVEASAYLKPNKTNINTAIGNIWKSLNGIQKSAYGFQWKYAGVENE